MWRWHTQNFLNMVTLTIEVNDHTALKLHYIKNQSTSTKVFKKSFSITFIDTIKNHSESDFLESKWNQLQATTNLNKTTLPSYR